MSVAGRPRILPALLATAAAFAVLITLGVWQLHRRDWKLGILAAIDSAESGPAMTLHGTPPPFSKVSVTGTLLPKAALYGLEVREQPNGQPREGAQVVEVLTRPNAAPVVVDLGWVAIDDGAPDPRVQLGVPAGPITIQGYLRPPEHPGWLSATDDPAARRFYTLDPARIAASLGVKDVAPYTLVVLGQPAFPGGPAPADTLPRPPNNHLQYAFTWFGLAGALVLVFGSWVRKSGLS